jgi:transposase
MPTQHTEDYKLSAVKYYLKNNKNMRETCEIFDCKFQSLARWINRYEEQENIKRKIRRNKKLKITPEIEEYVKTCIKKNSTITLWEISDLVEIKFDVSLSDMSIYSILKDLKISRKRVRSKYYPEKIEGQEQFDLDDFYNKLKKYKYDKTICIDETSIYLNMVLPYGRSKKGTRVIKKTNIYPFIRYNLLCAISANKVVGCALYEKLKGGVKTQNILDFYDKYIKDKYKDHLIIMDNAVIHRSKLIRTKIEENGNHLLYSVRYHPETNSIEEFFSQLKHYIKKKSPKTFEEIRLLLKHIIKNKIKKEHLTNYLKHSFRIYK